MKYTFLLLIVLVTISYCEARNITVYMQSRPEIIALYNDDGTLAYAWPASTGMRGYETPVRKWTAIAKNAYATSSKYHADMPFAIRLGPTYDGFNMHYDPIGNGSPASHGCIRQTFKGAITVFWWTSIGETIYTVNAPFYGHTTDPFDADFSRLYFMPGDHDSGVLTVQQMLVHANYLTAADVTGVYDDKTVSAVTKYQKDHNLSADGHAGIVTMQSLMAWLNVGF